MSDEFDVLVLGAGMVGVSCAYHALKRGKRVALIDRREPGEETSYGNTGVIDGGKVLPVAMPRDFSVLIRHALKQAPSTNYHLADLPALAPWMIDYWRWSAPDKLEQTARTIRPFFAAAVASHRAMAKAAGADHFFRDNGWLKLFRTEEGAAGSNREMELVAEFGLDSVRISRNEMLDLEPHLKPGFHSGIWTRDSATVSNPGAVTKAYAALFQAEGGVFLRGDASTLSVGPRGYSVEIGADTVSAPDVIVALGIWSRALLERFGLDVPMVAKRGYHRHFSPIGNSYLSRPVADMEMGYCLTPMDQGIRLTTGIEFAAIDAPKTPVQVAKAEAAAKDIFDLGEPVEAEPWMGRRPSTADSMPIVGPVPGRAGLWLAFGHGHWGFTLGPPTGEALAAMMAGETPIVPLEPYSVTRFGG